MAQRISHKELDKELVRQDFSRTTQAALRAILAGDVSTTTEDCLWESMFLRVCFCVKVLIPYT